MGVGKAKRNRHDMGTSSLVDGLDYFLCISEHSCQTDVKIHLSLDLFAGWGGGGAGGGGAGSGSCRWGGG